MTERQNLRNHALDNIKEFENILNEITSSNNSEEKKLIISECLETIFDRSANVEDDLNPANSRTIISDFIPIATYLERFPLMFNSGNSTKPVVFTNMFVSDVHTDQYTYLNVYFECIFTGTHKISNKSYEKISRIATIKAFPSQGSTRIVTVRFSNSSELSKIRDESIAFEQKFSPQKSIVIDSIIKPPSSVNEYSYYIGLANFSFTNKQYGIAKEEYRIALKFKPNDQFAADRLKEIEFIENPLPPNIVPTPPILVNGNKTKSKSNIVWLISSVTFTGLGLYLQTSVKDAHTKYISGDPNAENLRIKGERYQKYIPFAYGSAGFSMIFYLSKNVKKKKK